MGLRLKNVNPIVVTFVAREGIPLEWVGSPIASGAGGPDLF